MNVISKNYRELQGKLLRVFQRIWQDFSFSLSWALLFALTQMTTTWHERHIISAHPIALLSLMNFHTLIYKHIPSMIPDMRSRWIFILVFSFCGLSFPLYKQPVETHTVSCFMQTRPKNTLTYLRKHNHLLIPFTITANSERRARTLVLMTQFWWRTVFSLPTAMLNA